jgi:putative inorganic carbon (hco3(-)) transporter
VTELKQHRRFDYRLTLIPVLACLAICYKLYSASENDWITIAVFAALPLLAWMVLAQTEKLTYLLFALIPVSVPLKIGGAVVGFPSEGMIAVLVAFLLLTGAVKPFISRDIIRHPLVKLLLIEIAWMLICGLASDQPLVSLKRVFMRVLFVQLFLIYGAHLLNKNKSGYHLLFLLYAAGMIWPIIHSFLFHQNFNFTQSTAYRMCAPFFADHTIYGACIAFVLPMLLILTFANKTIRLRGILHMAVVALTLMLVGAEILSFSRAAWVSLIAAAVFGILLLARVKLRSIIVVLALSGIAVGIYSDQIYQGISKNDAISNKGDISDHLLSATNVQSDASNTERINRWMCAWKMALDKPITGYGPGMYQFEYGKYQERIHMTRISTFSGNRGHAHSEYFTQLSETGFPGALLFLVIVFSVIGYGMKVIYAETNARFKWLLYGAVLGLVTFYVHGIFNAFLDADKMAVLVFGSIAIIVSADLRQRSENRKSGEKRLY